MVRKLCVVLGAGASFDSVPSSKEVGVKREWTPPLAMDLFGVRDDRNLASGLRYAINANFQSVLQKYPRAEGLASLIRTRLERESLESILREIRDTEERHYLRGYQQVPMYLQELLGRVSRDFTTAPDNLNVLVARLLTADFDKIAFVTLNYDLLLERALETAGDSSPTSSAKLGLDWYTQGSTKWILAKLHGSVNWGRPVLDPPPKEYPGDDLSRSLALLEDCFAKDLHLGEIAVMPNGYEGRWRSEVFHYPALAVPVDDKYEPICPTEHVERLKTFLYDCPNFLFIGSSARDSDLIQVLGDINDCKAIAVVTEKQKHAEDVITNLQLIRIFGLTTGSAQLYSGGFSDFILGGQFDAFIGTCRST